MAMDHVGSFISPSHVPRNGRTSLTITSTQQGTCGDLATIQTSITCALAVLRNHLLAFHVFQCPRICVVDVCSPI